MNAFSNKLVWIWQDWLAKRQAKQSACSKSLWLTKISQLKWDTLSGPTFSPYSIKTTSLYPLTRSPAVSTLQFHREQTIYPHSHIPLLQNHLMIHWILALNHFHPKTRAYWHSSYLRLPFTVYGSEPFQLVVAYSRWLSIPVVQIQSKLVTRQGLESLFICPVNFCRWRSSLFRCFALLCVQGSQGVGHDS